MPTNENRGHGNLCSCRLLAEAAGCDPKQIGVGYCRNVLMRRWIVECNHGCANGVPAQAQHARWKDFGAIDPVKAILICNE